MEMNQVKEYFMMHIIKYDVHCIFVRSDTCRGKTIRFDLSILAPQNMI